MLPSEVLDQTRFLTKTSTTDGTGDDVSLLRILNDYILRQYTVLVNTNQNKFGRKADTSLNIAANQEAYRLPFDCFRVKRLEITYDGTNWHKIKIEDSSLVQSNALDSTSISQNYNTAAPRADIFGDAIYLRPIPTTSVSLGLRLWYIQTPTALTTSVISNASVIATPMEYHGYLSYGVGSEVALRQGNADLAALLMQKWNEGQGNIANGFPPQVLDQTLDFFRSDDSYA